jgi:hypothetical protein
MFIENIVITSFCCKLDQLVRSHFSFLHLLSSLLHQFPFISICFHVFFIIPMVLGYTTSLEQRAEPTTPLKTHLWHLMTPPHTPFVTAPSSIPWWAVLSCDPDLITHHFYFYFHLHLYCAAWTIVFGMVSTLMSTFVFNLSLKFHFCR